MKFRQIHGLFAAFAMALVMVAAAGPAARAFTMSGGGASASAGTANFGDPDSLVENFGGLGQPSTQFGSGPSSQSAPARPSRRPDTSGPIFRSLMSPIIGDGGYR